MVSLPTIPLGDCPLTRYGRFMPADALWTFAMACNVYLSFFHRYDATRLRTLEWRYLVACYGVPFLPALVFLFIDTPDKGKIYGDAVVSSIFTFLTRTDRPPSCGAGYQRTGMPFELRPSMVPCGSSSSSPCSSTSRSVWSCFGGGRSFCRLEITAATKLQQANTKHCSVNTRCETCLSRDMESLFTVKYRTLLTTRGG